MSTLTVRLPENMHARLRALARDRGISVNRLMDELATIALTRHDAETRFQAIAAKGSPARGIALLDKLDRAFAKRSRRQSAGTIASPPDFLAQCQWRALRRPRCPRGV